MHQRYVIALALALLRGTCCARADGTAASRYVAIGDSYTIGEGATPQESWPALLAAHLTQQGHPVDLIADPAVTGWTTRQAIDQELPVFRQSRPIFGTLLIGVNDWVQGVDEATFQAQLVQLMDGMLAVLPDKHRLVVVTIPDFSITPTGARYAAGRDASAGIAAFNKIIKAEATKRHLAVVDIFPLSKAMAHDPSLVAPDGLHPSAKEYAQWEQLIYPVAEKCLAAAEGH